MIFRAVGEKRQGRNDESGSSKPANQFFAKKIKYFWKYRNHVYIYHSKIVFYIIKSPIAYAS